jgi:hypothetical protein
LTLRVVSDIGIRIGPAGEREAGEAILAKLAIEAGAVGPSHDSWLEDFSPHHRKSPHTAELFFVQLVMRTEEVHMKDDPQELQITVWPLKLSAKGKTAVQAIRTPVTVVLIAFAIAVILLALSYSHYRPTLGGWLNGLAWIVRPP